ncbi:hypothetical protein J4729_07790 [Leisingera sp. HS039]|uniref:hypothetical protein n=1 Tax=Leisingera sp. HS039 TaxID=2818496 RepID=UPI001B3A46E7|nr:hypothetical protein [Leisingera sp. HS039]MBQ4824452.1 hypothetical protein [Leisingera sp. HS039]
MAAFSLSFPADYVLHIGAGSGRAAEGYVQAGLDPVLLAEADPEAMPGLQALAKRFAPVQAIAAAVSAKGGPGRFHSCNFAGLSSLAAPAEALYQLFPGLQVLAEETVETQAIADLAARCGLPKAGRGLLVLEAPGQALALLQALEQAECLQHFQTLRLQEGRDPLYRGAPGMAALRAGLEELGYISWLEAAPEDPDRPYAVAWRNSAALAAAEELQACGQAAEQDRAGLLQAAEQERAVAEQQLQACTADLAELQQRYGALLQEKEVQEDLLRRLADRLAPLAGDAEAAAPEPEE